MRFYQSSAAAFIVCVLTVTGCATRKITKDPNSKSPVRVVHTKKKALVIPKSSKFIPIKKFKRLFCGVWASSAGHAYPDVIMLEVKNEKLYLHRNENAQAGGETLGQVFELTQTQKDPEKFSLFTYVWTPKPNADPLEAGTKDQLAEPFFHVRLLRAKKEIRIQGYATVTAEDNNNLNFLDFKCNQLKFDQEIISE